MAILDLDNITFKKTIIGINCGRCGGNLKEVNKATLLKKIIAFVSLGTKKARYYECENCKRKHVVL